MIFIYQLLMYDNLFYLFGQLTLETELSGRKRMNNMPPLAIIGKLELKPVSVIGKVLAKQVNISLKK